MFTFDLTRLDSFKDLRDWLNKSLQQIRQASVDLGDAEQNGRVPMVVVGNKLDLCDKPQRNDRMV